MSIVEEVGPCNSTQDKSTWFSKVERSFMLISRRSIHKLFSTGRNPSMSLQVERKS